MAKRNHTLIIAEAGVNHNGDLATARRMVDIAAKCGADVVKFQTFGVEALVSRHARMAEYQKENLKSDESQRDMLSSLALSQDAFLELADYCGHVGVDFLSTPFDEASIRFLEPLQSYWKIPSGEITNYPYLVKIAETKKDVILSTGMSTMDEVDAAWKVLKAHGCGDIVLLHCTTEYPAPYDGVNLNAMHTLRARFQCEVGYSDHTSGIEIAVAAVALGASVIEKHFTLDRGMRGPDHAASLEPDELALLVREIRNVETAMGNGRKIPSDIERLNRMAARKSIVAAEKIQKGDIFTERNLTTKRPGNGVSPMLWKQVVGSAAIRDFAEDELIEL